MDSILDILGKINSGKINEVTQKELLLALFYEQKNTNDVIKDLAEDIKHLKEKDDNQDIVVERLEDQVFLLEKRLDQELAKKRARAEVLGWIGTILGIVATLVAIWSRISTKLGWIVYKTGLWGF